jgi:hypothetical protein
VSRGCSRPLPWSNPRSWRVCSAGSWSVSTSVSLSISTGNGTRHVRAGALCVCRVCRVCRVVFKRDRVCLHVMVTMIAPPDRPLSEFVGRLVPDTELAAQLCHLQSRYAAASRVWARSCSAVHVRLLHLLLVRGWM